LIAGLNEQGLEILNYLGTFGEVITAMEQFRMAGWTYLGSAFDLVDFRGAIRRITVLNKTRLVAPHRCDHIIAFG
jgi:hypothetical protein